MAGKKRKRGEASNTFLDAFAAGGFAALANEGYAQQAIVDSVSHLEKLFCFMKNIFRTRSFSAGGKPR